MTFPPEFLDTAGALTAFDLVGVIGRVGSENLGERYGPEPVFLGAFVATSAAPLALPMLRDTTVLIAGLRFGVLPFALPSLQSTFERTGARSLSSVRRLWFPRCGHARQTRELEIDSTEELGVDRHDHRTERHEQRTDRR